MRSFQDVLGLYDYALPPERIAAAPRKPRDSAKLLVVRRATGEAAWETFRDLPSLLPRGSVLVLNDTKVIPARLPARRATGGFAALLLLGVEGRAVRSLSNKRLRTGEFLAVSGKRGFVVEGVEGSEWILRPSFPLRELRGLLRRRGLMPLPPYIKRSPLTEPERRRAYQSVFAKEEGSIAAPTASLHFTERLLRELRAAGVTIATVTLHVHLGTFAPLTEEQWNSGLLHEERYRIDRKTARVLERAKVAGRPIVAVGTTVMRALESASDFRGRIARPEGATRIFIREGYDFRFPSGLITNFHVPRSSLLMLVAAFLGDRKRLLDLYREALSREYRFLSFGDAMLIL